MEQRGRFYSEFIDIWYRQTKNPNFMQPSSIHNLLLILFNFVSKCNGIGLHDQPLDLEDKYNQETIQIKFETSSKKTEIFEIQGTWDMRLGQIRKLAADHL